MATINLTAHFTEAGTPKTGLSPTVTVLDISDDSVDVNAQAMAETALPGWYKYTWTSFDLAKDYVATADGGAGQPTGERYAPIDMAGAALSGKIDVIDGIVDAIPTTPMRGTDGANTTEPDAAGVVAAFIGANGANLTDLLTATGFNVVVPPSLAQFNARSIPSADYTIVADLGTVQSGDSFARIGATGSGLTSLAQAALVTAARMGALTDWIDGGRLDALIDAIKAKTDNLKASWNDLSAAQVNAACDLALADYDGPTKAELDSGLAGLNDITVADILAGVIEGSLTLRQAVATIFSLLSLEASGGDTDTLLFRNLADTLDRVVMTADEDGNRLAITFNFSDL